MQHLSSRLKTRTLVHRTPSEILASLRTRTLKMGKKALKGIPLRAFFGHFSGSRSPRCGGLMKRPMHHLSSHVATRKMVPRMTPNPPALLRTNPIWVDFGRFGSIWSKWSCAEKAIWAKMAILGYPELHDAGVSGGVLCSIFLVAT